MPAIMEFWGIEVKSGQPHKINPGDSRVVHLSQASLGEVKKDKGSENVCIYLKVNDKKLVLGTLSPEKFPQLSFDLVLEKDFELSHNWKNGSVYFTGYKVSMQEGTVADSDDSDSDEDVKEISLSNNGTPKLVPKSVSEKPNATKPDASTAKQNVKDVKPNQKVDNSDSDNGDSKASSTDDDETSNDEDQDRVNGESDESSDELDESDEDDDEGSNESENDDDDEETPKKAEQGRKRPAESTTKTPVPEKKTKFITPQKTESKKGVVHTATPHPSKQAGKTPANSGQLKQQAQKSGSSYPCKSCNRSFTTEGGLQAHTKAKHSAAA